MNVTKCISESPAPYFEAVYHIFRVIWKYLSNQYDFVTLDSVIERGYATPMSMADVAIILFCCAMFGVIYHVFHSFVPRFLSLSCKELSNGDISKISTNLESLFHKLITVPWSLFVLFFGSPCPMTTMFSMVWTSTYQSMSSHILCLLSLSNYYFKLFVIFYLGFDGSYRSLLITHHITSIALITVASIFK